MVDTLIQVYDERHIKVGYVSISYCILSTGVSYEFCYLIIRDYTRVEITRRWSGTAVDFLTDQKVAIKLDDHDVSRVKEFL